jgi:hypothetical protein
MVVVANPDGGFRVIVALPGIWERAVADVKTRAVAIINTAAVNKEANLLILTLRLIIG